MSTPTPALLHIPPRGADCTPRYRVDEAGAVPPPCACRAGGRWCRGHLGQAWSPPPPPSPTEGTWRRTGSWHHGPAPSSLSQGWRALVGLRVHGFTGSSLAGPRPHLLSSIPGEHSAPSRVHVLPLLSDPAAEGGCPWAWLEGKGRPAAAASQVPGGT